MKVYNSLYYWDIMEKIQSGKLVYLLDKEEQKVYCVNDMRVDKYAETIVLCSKNTGRFTIWIEEETEAKEE